jgi:hypothetical protein
MSKLELKPEFQTNFTLTKVLPGIGMIKFDSKVVDPADYPKWSALGFDDLFQEVVTKIVKELIKEGIDEVGDWIEHKIENHKAKRKRVPKDASK